MSHSGNKSLTYRLPDVHPRQWVGQKNDLQVWVPVQVLKKEKQQMKYKETTFKEFY